MVIINDQEQWLSLLAEGVRKLSGAGEMFCILLCVLGPQVFTHLKTYQTVQLIFVHFM